jgi:hypothetical protein
MDNASFDQMSALLRAVWPAISEIDWSEYCTKNVAPYDNDGVAKYTGILMHRSGAGCSGASSVAVGFLPYPTRSAVTVAKKVRLILEKGEAREDCISSMHHRNPEEGFWGGGIRGGNINEAAAGIQPTACAITGLPELGDHALMAHMMYELGQVDEQRFNCLRELHICGTKEAMAYVGMKDQQYVDLCRRIYDIVHAGCEKICLLSFTS